MSHTQIESRLAEAITLREAGDDVRARDLLLELCEAQPDDARVNLQTAWVHDKLGLEREAIPFYQRALHLGLHGEELRDALLGLGSTHRALGEYEESAEVLSRGVREFPDYRPMHVFMAMTEFNLGRSKQAFEQVLSLLAETTADPSLAGYRPALVEYAADIERTWQ